jgi:glycosyltransferase involved in cell wall biosynthesis
MSKNYILIGAKPPSQKVSNPGGQLTACLGLIDYIEKKGDSISVIDTTQSSFPIPPMSERVLKGGRRTLTLIKLLLTTKVDGVIIFSSSGFSFYEKVFQSFICRLMLRKSILFVRSGHFMNTLNNSKLQRRLCKILLKLPYRIGIQGRTWSNFYQELGINSNALVLSRNWLDDEFPVAKSANITPKSPISFIFVGWLVEEKGVKELLEAAKLLSGEKQFTLHLVGGGALESFCNSYVLDNGLQEFVKLHGWQNKNSVIKLLKQSDVFILPSKAEGFPNALLEALALAMPSIVSDVGAVSDSLINEVNGFLLPNGSTEEIVYSMKTYLNNTALIPEHSLNALNLYFTNHQRNHNCEILLKEFN